MLTFINNLKVQLSEELPGEDAQFKMAPIARPRMKEALAKAVNPRSSAVLVYFFPRETEWHIVLMKRPDYDGTHSGQVSFPGGKLEEGEDFMDAALREFEEETGVRAHEESVIGQLSNLYIYPSNFLVQPFVAFGTEEPVYNPDPLEVADIIELPTSTLLSDQIITTGPITLSSGHNVRSPYFDVNGHTIWGATAMMLSELKEILRAIP